MAVMRMDHVGLNVADLEAATAFFVALGLEVEGRAQVGDERVARIVGLGGARSDITMLRAPDGRRVLELVRFLAPEAPGGDQQAPAHAPGLRHLCFAVDDLEATLERLAPHGGTLVGEVVDYGDAYRLCYLRGPEGVIVELAQALR